VPRRRRSPPQRRRFAAEAAPNEATAAPLPPPAQLPLNPTPEPGGEALQAGCCWEERLPGASGPQRCSAPVTTGKAWCEHHLHRWRLGQMLKGKSPLRRG
jgi:hypothetical protein